MMDGKITVKEKYLFINCAEKRVGLTYIPLVEALYLSFPMATYHAF